MAPNRAGNARSICITVMSMNQVNMGSFAQVTSGALSQTIVTRKLTVLMVTEDMSMSAPIRPSVGPGPGINRLELRGAEKVDPPLRFPRGGKDASAAATPLAKYSQ